MRLPTFRSSVPSDGLSGAPVIFRSASPSVASEGRCAGTGWASDVGGFFSAGAVRASSHPDRIVQQIGPNSRRYGSLIGRSSSHRHRSMAVRCPARKVSSRCGHRAVYGLRRHRWLTVWLCRKTHKTTSSGAFVIPNFIHMLISVRRAVDACRRILAVSSLAAVLSLTGGSKASVTNRVARASRHIPRRSVPSRYCPA